MPVSLVVTPMPRAAEIGLVSCTKTKRDEPASPRELYAPSTLFSKASTYCEREHDAWYILSAKYGLLNPDGAPVEPDDETLTEATVAEREAWAEQVADEMEHAGLLDEGTELVFHAGNAYTEPLTTLLEDRVASIRNPTEGLMIGERLAWYNQHTA